MCWGLFTVKYRNLFHFLPVLQGLQVLHETLRAPEVFLADGAGGDDSPAGQLRSRKHQKICSETLL